MSNQVFMNKRAVRENKAIKAAQKEAKKFYGRVRGTSPKLKIQTMVSISKNDYVSLLNSQPVIDSNSNVSLTADELIVMVNEANLTGLSGNGFSTAAKLEALHNSKAAKKYLIVNGVECDPGLVHDKWILQNRQKRIEKGINILNQVFQFHNMYLASKTSISYEIKDVETKLVPNKYPMGQERVLIANVLNVSLDKETIPVQEGILVINVQTVCAIADIADGKKLENRILTIANMEDAIAKTVEVPLGSNIKEVIKKVFPDVSGQGVFAGGGFMSCHAVEDSEKVDLTTNFIAYGKATEYEDAKCKGCGACAAKCPAGVVVYKIIQALEKGQTEGLEVFHPEKCIGCGACSFVCHAHKNIQKDIARVNGKML